MRKLIWCVVLLLAVCAVGCGGSSGSNQIDIAGSWSFSSQSSLVMVSGNATMQQSGNALSGQVTLNGTPCATSATLTGTISGSMVNFQLQEGSQAVSFTGTVTANGTGVSGTYTAPTGGCTNGDSGSWAATKIS